MAKDLIVALDEGTSNAKAVVIDGQGKVVAKASRALGLETPQPGWVEQKGEGLINATLDVLRDVIGQIDLQRLAGIGISNQRETAIGWYRATGLPIGPALTWQCSRSAAFCDGLRRDRQEERIRLLTGLPVAPLFSASKMRWLLDHTPDGQQKAENGEICLGTIDAWLLWHLTGGKVFRCDMSNAARTQLLNLKTGCWDEEMLALFGLPKTALPDISPSSSFFGETFGIPGVPDGIVIASMVGDSHAALYGHALGEMGSVKATYGTGSSVMAPVAVPDTSLIQLATTVAWHDGQQAVFGLEGNIPHTGDGVAWMLEMLGLGEEGPQLLNTLPATIEDTQGVYFVPALTGTGAPWWDDRARGLIAGLSRGTGRPHMIRAALEAVAYQIADVVYTMKKHPDFHLSVLMADGGPTRNDWLMQFQADLLGCPVSRSNTPELSALGAGLLARKMLEGKSREALYDLLPEHDVFTPDESRHQRLKLSYQAWQETVQRTLWHPQHMNSDIV